MLIVKPAPKDSHKKYHRYDYMQVCKLDPKEYPKCYNATEIRGSLLGKEVL
jgi:hypothetical protein